MDVLAKHKIGSTPVLRSQELALRRVGRLVKDEGQRWGSEDPFPREVAPRITGAHEREASLHAERGRASLRSGVMLRGAGAPRPGRSSPGGRRRASERGHPPDVAGEGYGSGPVALVTQPAASGDVPAPVELTA